MNKIVDKILFNPITVKLGNQFQNTFEDLLFIQFCYFFLDRIKTDSIYLLTMTMTKNDSFRNVKCGVASFAANYIAGVLHPFDVIKTRFQSHDGKGSQQNLVPKYKGIYHAFKEIIAQEGIKGIFKGFYVSLLTQAIASSIFFCIYQSRKEEHIKQKWSPLSAVSVASLEAGVFASIVTQPFWVIKTRMLLNIVPQIGEYGNFIDKTKEIYRQYGFRGFMKGLSLNIWLSALGISQMFFYEGSKILYDYLPIPQSAYSEKNFVCGSISKIMSGLIMYPLTTVRTRIQQNQYVGGMRDEKYKGVWQITKLTMFQEGIRGFYKGLAPNIIKGIPQKGIYFYFYELIKQQVFDIKETRHHQ